ncbi:hypothetical protein [Actinoplanes sp. NPDC049265]|uniref:hypothetical protein n=1 Tax=Actinoplanes sp. NPDC049265 TaxID=3363902 RepID=UPI003723F77B
MTVVPALGQVVPLVALLALVGVTLFLAYTVLAHNRGLCERCVRALPLDAGAVAGRYRLRFRVAHLFERKAFVALYLLVVAGSALLSTHPVGRYGWAAVQATMAYLLFVYVTHQRLQPWCPKCRNGGEETRAPIQPVSINS